MLRSRGVGMHPSQPSRHRRQQNQESSGMSPLSEQQTLKDENVHPVGEGRCPREKLNKLSAECCFLIFNLRRKPLCMPGDLSRDEWSSALRLDVVARARGLFPGQGREPGEGEGEKQTDVLLYSFLRWAQTALLLGRTQAPEMTGQTFRRSIQHMILLYKCKFTSMAALCQLRFCAWQLTVI